MLLYVNICFFFNATATPEIYTYVHTLSLHDALPISDVQAAMRAYLYARLIVDLPGYRPKLPPASIRQAFNRARRFFAFARERLGRLDVSRIDQALVDAYARHLRADPARRPGIVGHLLEVVPAQIGRPHVGTPVTNA